MDGLDQLAWPLPLILIVCVCGYLVVVLIAILVWLSVRKNGTTKTLDSPEVGQCCACCSGIANCGTPYPSFRALLKSCCPNQNLSCEAVVLCQCFRRDQPTPNARSGFFQCNQCFSCQDLNCVCCDIAVPQRPTAATVT